jgi:hypothetical protein
MSGIVWVVIMLITFSNSPSTNILVSEREKEFIHDKTNGGTYRSGLVNIHLNFFK